MRGVLIRLVKLSQFVKFSLKGEDNEISRESLAEGGVSLSLKTNVSFVGQILTPGVDLRVPERLYTHKHTHINTTGFVAIEDMLFRQNFIYSLI